MTVAEFVAKWRKVELTERSASQQHFLDLCEVFAHPISKIVEKSRDPEHFAKLIGQLFDAMNSGGDFGLETIRHFSTSPVR
jgi:hypothetical protein